MQRSACSCTRSSPRTRRGASPASCFKRPKHRSTAPRPRYRSPNRLVLRGMSGFRRSALIQTLAGEHARRSSWPLLAAAACGQRHFVRLFLKSAPANVQRPCSQVGTASCVAAFRARIWEMTGAAVLLLEPVMDEAGVVALVHRARLRPEAASAGGVEQGEGELRLMVPGRLDLPRDGKLGTRADGRLNLEPVETAALPGRDCGTVSPRGVRVGVAFALRPVLGEEPLAVRVGGHVGGVDRDVPAIVGQLGTEGRAHGGKACVERGFVRPELRREAVAGIDGRCVSEGVTERGVLGDQRGRPAPRRDRVDGLHEARADQRTRPVPLPACPAERVKIGANWHD